MFHRLALIASIALAGCTAAPVPTAPAASDTTMNAALQAPLLTDPDLSGMNGRNLAIAPSVPVTPPQAVPGE